MNAKNLEALKALTASHKQKTRDSGEMFYVFDCPQEAYSFEDWGEILDPWDDDTYKIAGFALAELVRVAERGDDLAEWDATTWADLYTPVYTSELMQWLQNTNHHESIEEVFREFNGRRMDSFAQYVSIAYSRWAAEIADQVRALVMRKLAEPEAVTA